MSAGSSTISRRSFLGAAPLALAGPSAAASRPNVLLLIADDLRDWTGYLETQAQVQTPNLDRLARRGLTFERAYCPAPVCSPSRTSTLTGLSPATTGVYENGQQWRGSLRQHPTLTQQFMQAGYHVAGSGKVYHGQGDGPVWHDYEYGEYSPPPKRPDIPEAFGNPLDIPDSETGDGRRAGWAIRKLAQRPKTPLFLACGMVRPHTPWDVPRKYFDMYDLDRIDLPPMKETDLDDLPPIGRRIAERPHKQNGKTWHFRDIAARDMWKTNVRAYLASITFADAQLGRVLDAWDASPYAKNGVIVLWGDHGWHLGEKLHWSKRTLWEVGTRTPFLVSAPGVTKPGSRCQRPVSLLDLYPTLADLCSLPRPDNLDGTTLRPLLEAPVREWDRPAVSVWGRDNFAVRSEGFRYIRYSDGGEELYDARKDPNEWDNLAGIARYRNVIKRHRRWLPKSSAPPTPFNKNRTSFFEPQ